MNLKDAIELMKKGRNITRVYWNELSKTTGQTDYIHMLPGSNRDNNKIQMVSLIGSEKSFREWSPSVDDFSAIDYKEFYDNRISTLNNMDFGGALSLLKSGKTVKRLGWIIASKFLEYVPEAQLHISFEPQDDTIVSGAYIVAHTNGYVVPWTATQDDILAEDWVEFYTKAN